MVVVGHVVSLACLPSASSSIGVSRSAEQVRSPTLLREREPPFSDPPGQFSQGREGGGESPLTFSVAM